MGCEERQDPRVARTYGVCKCKTTAPTVRGGKAREGGSGRIRRMDRVRRGCRRLTRVDERTKETMTSSAGVSSRSD
eukprot:760593-Hanusia_phi.AAC.16